MRSVTATRKIARAKRSPLRVPEGACSIDTTNLSVDEVFELMVDKIKFFGVSFRC